MRPVADSLTTTGEPETRLWISIATSLDNVAIKTDLKARRGGTYLGKIKN